MSCKTCSYKGSLTFGDCCTIEIDECKTEKLTGSVEKHGTGAVIGYVGGQIYVGALTEVDGQRLEPVSMYNYVKDKVEECCGQAVVTPIDSLSVSHVELCLNDNKIVFEVCKDASGDITYAGSDGSFFPSFAAVLAAGYVAECPGESISISHVELCLNNEKVIFEACKDQNGDTTYTGSNGAVFTSYAAIFAAGYEVECEKEFVCTEVVYNLDSGNTVSYADLLAYANGNATFDDGSAGAEGISLINFVNMTDCGMTFTYNGTTKTETAGQFGFGNTDKPNPVSTDLSITSEKDTTTITYVVYKCI